MTAAINILKDRFTFFLPVNTGFVTEGEPDRRFLQFYTERSSPELYCSIVGNVVVPNGYGSNSSTPAISDIPVWTEIAKSIKAGGSKPGIQLTTAWEGYRGNKKFRSKESDAIISEAKQLIASMNSDLIKSVLESFKTAAHIAVKQHGFEHIQFHAAHGYLLSLLIDQRFNQEATRVLDMLASLAERLKCDGVETSIRISLKTGDEVFDSNGSSAFLDSITALPFDFVDLSSGFYNVDKRLIYPSTSPLLEARLNESIALGLRHPRKLFIISGHISARNWAEIPSNLHPGLCRDLIANPQFLSDLQDGCRNHSKCHYYSRGAHHLTCGRWLTE